MKKYALALVTTLAAMLDGRRVTFSLLKYVPLRERYHASAQMRRRKGLEVSKLMSEVKVPTNAIPDLFGTLKWAGT
jgi:hypothetical protein